MFAAVRAFCERCEACAKSKRNSGKVPGFLTLPSLPQGPFFRVHLDTICGLPTSQGYEYVLVVMDCFTKFIFTHPLRSMHPRQVVEALTLVFTRFGSPTYLVADNGREFRNKELVTFLSLWGVRWNFSAPYNPQANGQAEAGVKIVSARLRSALTDLRDKDPDRFKLNRWSVLLPYVTMSYNVTPNLATGFAPFELIFGRPPPLPLTEQLGPLPVVDGSTPTPQDYFEEVQVALKEAFEGVTADLVARRRQYEAQFNQHRSALHVAVGDSVFILYPYNVKLNKLLPKAFGPFPVVEVVRHEETNHVKYVVCDVAPRGADTPQLVPFPRRRIRHVIPKSPVSHGSELSSVTSHDILALWEQAAETSMINGEVHGVTFSPFESEQLAQDEMVSHLWCNL